MALSDPRATLGALVAQSGASYAALSRLLGRNAAYLQQFVTRGSPRRLSERDRQLLAAYFGVSEQALGAAKGAAAPPMVRVPRFDVTASAGPGALIESEARIGALGLDPALIARLGARPADLSLIRAAGESMAPTIADGDELLVDRGDRRVGKGGIFVIRIDGALLVKRVSRHGGGFLIASDNPAYPPIDAPAPDVIGRVVWLSRALS